MWLPEKLMSWLSPSELTTATTNRADSRSPEDLLHGRMMAALRPSGDPFCLPPCPQLLNSLQDQAQALQHGLCNGVSLPVTIMSLVTTFSALPLYTSATKLLSVLGTHHPPGAPKVWFCLPRIPWPLLSAKEACSLLSSAEFPSHLL